MPLLNDLMSLVHACETAGGSLRAITIDAAADPGQSTADYVEVTASQFDRGERL